MLCLGCGPGGLGPEVPGNLRSTTVLSIQSENIPFRVEGRFGAPRILTTPELKSHERVDAPVSEGLHFQLASDCQAWGRTADPNPSKYLSLATDVCCH